MAVASLFSLVPRAPAAPYAPAAPALIDWTPNVTSGVGVPGGIPARSTIYTTITSTGDTTDRTDDIQNALIACPTGQTVLLGPGVFYIRYAEWRAGHGNNKTLRGSGSNPASGGTTIKIPSGGNGFYLRGSESYNTPYYGDITGSPAKGATTLAITNATTDMVGRLAELITENDATLPVVSVGGAQGVKKQVVLVTAVDTGAGTMTFQPPLYQTPVKRTGGALAMRWAGQHGLATLRGFGVEDLTIDHTLSTYSFAVWGIGMHGCWLKNIRVRGALNHGIYLTESSQIELRDSFIEESRDSNWVSSNHGGLGLSAVSGSLIENNIIVKHFPLIKLESSAVSGNVFGYNFLYEYANVYVAGTHNAGNHCNLWEGSSTSGFGTDGYFGSAADEVFYRNDAHGVINGSGIPHYPFHLSRWTRRFELVGNQLGRPGSILNIEATHPTAFNGSNNGDTANNYAGDPHTDLTLTGTLTTRIDDGAGTITFNSTVGYLENPDIGANVLGVTWGTGFGSGRFGLSKGTVNAGALTCSFTGPGYGTALPPVGTAVQLWPGSNGYREIDNGTMASIVLLGNYYYSDGQIPAGQALGSTTLPASLYRAAKPAFMSGYNWPPFDPVTLDPRFAAIPAGARYEAETNKVASPSFSPSAGAYSGTQTVTITCATSGATIYYTTDGTTPTTSSSIYSSALSITVSPSTTLKAFAVKSGMTDSGVTSGVYSLLADSTGTLSAGTVNATNVNKVP